MLPSLAEEAKRAQRRSAVTNVRFGHPYTGQTKLFSATADHCSAFGYGTLLQVTRKFVKSPLAKV